VADSLYLEPGRSIRGSSGKWYKIQQLLGAGGNAVTYLVVCSSGPNRGILFALKFFRRMSKPERLSAFLDELDFLKSCDHPAVMRVYDDGTFSFRVDGQQRDFPFLVAEYLPRTMFQVMRSGAASTTEKLAFANQLLAGLAYLAAQDPPVVHRDVKPQNIFIKGHSAVLGDFGLLKRLDGLSESEDRDVLKESVGVGMPFFYRTPDLVTYARREGPIDTKSDVFQLGLVLTELFTGRNPCARPLGDDPLSPVELEGVGTIPGGASGLIAPILHDMLTINPVARPTAADLLDRWLGVLEIAAERARELNGTVF
jgi:serine/threonine-protein kinase